MSVCITQLMRTRFTTIEEIDQSVTFGPLWDMLIIGVPS